MLVDSTSTLTGPHCQQRFKSDAEEWRDGRLDFTAKIWDALTGDELHSFEHKHIVRAYTFSEDTYLLLTGSEDGTIRIWQTGPINHDDGEVPANGSAGKLKIDVDEVAWKIEGFQVAKDKKAKEKKESSDV
ncbi:hypothetical protein IFM89_022817 [Coptis chinensis]|uniref:Serine-threonine kinase receptor-associated protein n=1 Tax=Coptis chinensis TaxID=261450 RepID=A0A835HJ81_9MAGN|nr:hypothetical protein IFM89_022817 [Coptis chinensis]